MHFAKSVSIQHLALFTAATTIVTTPLSYADMLGTDILLDGGGGGGELNATATINHPEEEFGMKRT